MWNKSPLEHNKILHFVKNVDNTMMSILMINLAIILMII